ncbi:hypothetical protein BSYN_15380 [Bacteroides sedimenti]|uniref:DUF5018 domain-containing protein n=2 Tax=Bacteroides sedimenti TaxID=2136147 RepID=A0ABN6Z3W0_9BACE
MIAIFSLLLGMNSCVDVENLTPSVSREGINSIKASFDNDDSSENSFTSEIDYENGIITIVFPYNYPRTSENVLTMDKLKHVRVVANLDDNVTISPAILYMDLTKDNYITVTDQSKKKKTYKVIAEIRKSAECVISSFEIPTAGLSGVIDEGAKTISLISLENIGSVLAKVSVSHGATMSPDPTKQAQNYDNEVKINVTAQNGTTSTVYTVKKAVPSKTEFGLRAGSGKVLWSKKLNSELGISVLNLTGGIAATKDYVVINTRNQNSIYLDRKTGAIAGTLNLGDNVGNLVNFYNTCDDNDNILLCNLSPNAGAFKIWKIKGVTGTPQPFIEWNGGLAMGRKISVKGSIDGDAIITAPIYAAGNQFARWQVKGGVLQSQTPNIITVSGLGGSWGTNCDIVYTDPTNVNSDYFAAFYASPYKFAWISGATNTLKTYLPSNNAGNWIPNATDYAVFNKCPYAVYNTINSFTWGSDDSIYLFDVSTTSSITSPVWNAPIGTYGGKDNGGQNANGTGDVALKVSDNGYYMYLYFMFTNGCVVCVQYDCINM